MVNRRAPSLTPEATNINGDVDALTEMHAAMEELHIHNQILEDDAHNIRQRLRQFNSVIIPNSLVYNSLF